MICYFIFQRKNKPGRKHYGRSYGLVHQCKRGNAGYFDQSDKGNGQQRRLEVIVNKHYPIVGF